MTIEHPILSVNNLSHKYQIQWAVKDIDFEITRKGIYGLLGANGAGKSTIMNIMSGVLNQSHGEVFIKGINIKEQPIEAKKKIGFLPQKPPLLLEMTVEEFLIHAARLRLMDRIAIPEAVDIVLEKCALTHFKRRVLSNLSGGYQQRVGIAQAIIHNPEIVIFDEPTNGLDPNQILEVRKLIKSIAEERTVILSTHILQEVQALCDQIWMIHEGTMVFTGSLHDFDTHLSPSVLKVILKGLPSTSELEDIPGILSACHMEKAEYHLEYDLNEETLERLVEKSMEKGWRLIEIVREKKSLENVFATLSQHRK
ncbi:ABC transporter ATP-binding protein [Sphingobacterium paucimobilis]|uniref:ABC transporter domain-containing protein n=1 Tax=Sphingobacterium paucimobilis HER1398 TaxID=1346330 RepID=U2HV97_9SPHI|nr:ABC transporter ATP-binding protein [Sphingobacterium paucimobilis]ERJ59200.1 hypothetical protein M472_10490 [Sphingobacterium paucimobilis HER1398]